MIADLLIGHRIMGPSPQLPSVESGAGLAVSKNQHMSILVVLCTDFDQLVPPNWKKGVDFIQKQLDASELVLYNSFSYCMRCWPIVTPKLNKVGGFYSKTAKRISFVQFVKWLYALDTFEKKLKVPY